MAAELTRLSLKGIVKSFGATAALGGVDLELKGGEVHALLGANGAGKSTLMKVLSGALAPDSGAMTLEGKPYAPTDPLDARRSGVAMIYQELSALPNLTVAENIALGDEPRTALGFLDRRALATRARAALKSVGVPGLESLDPATALGALPLATQQLVEIAKATSIGARVLIFDEPTSSLSRGESAGLFALIERLRSGGLAIAYISHFLEETRSLAARYTVLRDGRSVGQGELSKITDAELIALMLGRVPTAHASNTARAATDVVLSARGRGETLELSKGEVIGLAGLAGGGRTELLRALFGLDAAPDLEIRLRGRVVRPSPVSSWASGLGFVSEDRKTEGLALALSIAANTVLTRPLGPGRARAAGRRWISELSTRARGPDQPVGELSGGNQQKVAIARLLQHDCDIFLLDEPTRGIDVGSKADVYALVDRIVSQGRSVLLTSSDLGELLRVCDRIGVMSRGQLKTIKPTSQWTEHTLLAQMV